MNGWLNELGEVGLEAMGALEGFVVARRKQGGVGDAATGTTIKVPPTEEEISKVRYLATTFALSSNLHVSKVLVLHHPTRLRNPLSPHLPHSLKAAQKSAHISSPKTPPSRRRPPALPPLRAHIALHLSTAMAGPTQRLAPPPTIRKQISTGRRAQRISHPFSTHAAYSASVYHARHDPRAHFSGYV